MAGVTIDIKSLPKVAVFSGEDRDWIEWSFAMRSCCHLLNMGPDLQAVEGLAAAPDASVMGPVTLEKS